MAFDLFSYIMGRNSVQGGGSGGGGATNTDGWHLASHKYDANEEPGDFGYKMSSETPTPMELLGGTFLCFTDDLYLGGVITEEHIDIEPELGSAMYNVNLPTNMSDPPNVIIVTEDALVGMFGLDPVADAELINAMKGIWLQTNSFQYEDGYGILLLWKP